MLFRSWNEHRVLHIWGKLVSIQDVKDITVGGDIQELLSQVDVALETLNTRRPFSPETETRIRTTFLPDRVTATLNIEGIHVTRRQTLAVMDAMAINSSPQGDETEIRNVLMADELAYETATAQELPSSSFVRSLNELVLKDINPLSGQFRPNDVRITGADFEPPSHVDVPSLIQGMCDGYEQGDYAHPIIQAAWLHNQFTFIHPFVDGNGRTARILQDYSLLRRRMYPVGVASHKRDDYYAALQEADNGKWDDLVELIALSQVSIATKIDALTLEPARRQAWVSRLATAASTKKAGALHKQYLVWKERMTRIQESFLTAATEIDLSSSEIGASYKEFDPIDFEKWKSISASGSYHKTWAFSLIFYVSGAPFYKMIAFYRRHKSDAYDNITSADGVVSLAITGQSMDDSEKPNFANFHDEQIRLREVLYAKDDLICYEYNDSTKSVESGDCDSPGDLVQRLFEDVFLRKAGLAG